MKNYVIIIFVLAFTVMTGAIAQKHNEEHRHFDESFTKIKVSNAIHVRLKTKNKDCNFKGTCIVVKAEKDFSMEKLKTKISNRKLKIYYCSSISKNNKIRLDNNNIKVDVYVVTKNIQSITTSSASSVSCESPSLLADEHLSLKSSSASSINLNVDVRELKLESSSASSILLQGICDHLKIRASSASSINTRNLKTSKTNINSSSASMVVIGPTKYLEAAATSGSSIRYLGEPKVKTKVSSSASIRSL